MLQLMYMDSKHRKLIDIAITIVVTVAIVWAFWSFFQGQAVFDLFSNDAERFREYLVGLGPAAEVAYIWLVMLEVLIAFIPGWFVYPVGSAVFGFATTIFLVMTANFLGGSLSFWIGRRWGKPLLQRFIAPNYISKFDAYMERNGTWAIFFLKINPITSLDIFNYLAGATPIKFWKFTLANMLGILPLVIFSAALGEQSYEVAPQILGVLLLLAIVYVVWFFVNLPGRIKKLRS